jgi:hypothetical protein
MQYLVKENTDETFFVILLDSTDLVTAVTGKTATDTTIQYSKGTGDVWSTYNDTGMWNEVGNGVYSLTIGASEFITNNRYVVRVSVSGCADYMFVVKVMDYSDYEIEKTVRMGR